MPGGSNTNWSNLESERGGGNSSGSRDGGGDSDSKSSHKSTGVRGTGKRSESGKHGGGYPKGPQKGDSRIKNSRG